MTKQWYVDAKTLAAPALEAVADPLVIDRVVSNLPTNAARYGRPPIIVSAPRPP